MRHILRGQELRMPRINIDDTLRNDPRFEALCQELGKPMAYGTLICLWDLGMAYWRQSKSLIPHHIFNSLQNASHLLRLGFVELRDGFVYCRGAEEKWKFILSHSENGKKGGVASAESRNQKYGTKQPIKEKKPKETTNFVEAEPKRNEAKRSPLPLPLPLPQHLPQPATSTKNICTPAKAGGATPVAQVRKVFLESWKAKYGRDYPSWGAKENGQASTLLKSAAIEKILPVLAFYPNWIDSFAVRQSHSFGVFCTNLVAIETAMINQPEALKRNAEARKITQNPEEFINGLDHDKQIRERLRTIAEKTRAPQQQIQNKG